ncbi:2-dehydro-3-deoxygalactonokinase [Maritimibacter sp. DP1N21-5]|uniref:2-dehydro-3-deoxygalactonokinase n=1 Tax=Maritimibacter sp. DP1N21-5 TaxID=2836867 RepID=UPI001C44CF16|nr:2-dehydro-3-deoxygalactonokinase [Maritimibacter sp. DP1N21-5]MBV7410931.1 2-dehydro-3-deoxygalactonokinase [Maritimibacter sp. DP1N21-5]
MSVGSEWMAVDWGRTRLRVWIMNADGTVLDELSSDDGSDGLGAGDLEPTLARLIAGHLQDDAETDVIIAGPVAMPGLWCGGDLRTVPCKPPGPGDLTRARVRDERLRVSLVRGIGQNKPDALMFADALRVAGLLAGSPGFDGVVCQPGPVSHWVHVSAGEIVSFQQVLTGKLMDMTARAVGISPQGPQAPNDFLAAFDDMLSKPQAMAARIGAVEAGLMMDRFGADVARARIAGVFVGAELAATKPYWLGQRVALVDGGDLYQGALSSLGIAAEVFDEGEMLLAGFRTVMAGSSRVT